MAPSKVKKTKQHRRQRYAPRSEWALYIKRIARKEGCYIHSDALDILNQNLNWLVDQLASQSKNLLQATSRQTYTRKTMRLAAAVVLSKQKALLKEALKEEKAAYEKFKQDD